MRKVKAIIISCIIASSVFTVAPTWAVDMELVNINKIEEFSKTGKPVTCTYKGVKYKIVGIAKDIIGHVYVAGRVGNSPVFISKGDSPFFNVRADHISGIKIEQ